MDQKDLDKQKIRLAEQEGRQTAREKDFAERQDEFYGIIEQLKQGIGELIKAIT